MLTIRANQLSIFESAREREYINRLKRKLESELPGLSNLGGEIERCVSEAAEFGFRSEHEVARFVEITCVCLGGLPPDSLPRSALAILMAYGMDPSLKLDRYQAWAEARSVARTEPSTEIADTEPMGAQPVGAAVLDCHAKSDTKPQYWIEIELVGEDDQPIPWEEYTVRLPDGKQAKGYLDDQGFARFDGLMTGGACMVSFPNLDSQAWDRIATLDARGETP
jgi:hypothetical protein